MAPEAIPNSRRRSKPRADDSDAAAGEGEDVCLAASAAARRIPLHGSRKAAVDFHFQKAAKAHANAGNRNSPPKRRAHDRSAAEDVTDRRSTAPWQHS